MASTRKDPASTAPELPALLAEIAAGTTGTAGEGFFRALVRHLARALGGAYALVAEASAEGRARVLAHHAPEGPEAPAELDLAGTAWERAAEQDLLHVPRGVRALFPRDALLAAHRAEGFLGAVLGAPDGRRLGYLCVLDARPLAADASALATFRIFAARAAAELARLLVVRTLGESEERFRDLFDEAPIAYVHEGLDTRFLRANRAALRAFEIGPEDVPGTYGKSFVVDSPDNQRRLKEAFDSVGRGTDTSGVVLELRRRKSGKPLWIQWWSKPDPGGAYTRTMFIDITERVLLEQEQARLKEQNRYLREEIKSVHDFEEIVGRSAGLVGVLANVARVAATDSTVLITGETGTGKELVARAIHSASKRHDRPLIKLNCAALPTGLVESELFGHEKGAFSGAIARRVGRFELAHCGTIFLDEIGDMPPEVQVKLLRVLQEHEFERVGGSTPIQSDVRVIAATNRDLTRLIAQEKFRGDLFYRLNVFPIHLPPLRERGDDIPLLLQFFLKKFSARIGKPVDDVTPEFLRRFRSYSWPGNVRELENLVERAVILATSSTLDVDSIPVLAEPADGRHGPAPAGAGARLEAVERDHIVATLERAGWVIEGPAGAARILDLHPNTLRSRMKRLGIVRGTPTAR